MFAICRADGVVVEHKYVPLSKEELAVQLMNANDLILRMVNDENIDADYKITIVKAIDNDEIDEEVIKRA